jgi:hypothetical protein
LRRATYDDDDDNNNGDDDIRRFDMLVKSDDAMMIYQQYLPDLATWLSMPGACTIHRPASAASTSFSECILWCLPLTSI